MALIGQQAVAKVKNVNMKTETNFSFFLKMLLAGLIVGLSSECMAQAQTGNFIQQDFNGIVRYRASNLDSNKQSGFYATLPNDTFKIRLTKDSAFIEATNPIVINSTLFYKVNPIAGAVLTSDEQGRATWQPVSVSLSIGNTITGATNGSILFSKGGQLSQNNQRFFYDTLNNLVGIGLNNPTARLTVKGTNINSSSFALAVHDSTGSSNALMVRNDNFVGFGNSTPSARVHISGTGDLLRISNGSTGIFVNTSSGLVFRAASNHFVRFQDYLGGNEISYDANGVTLHNTTNITGGLVVTTTTAGILLPRLTTSQRDAIVTPQAGLFIYNTTTNRPNFFDGTNWVSI